MYSANSVQKIDAQYIFSAARYKIFWIYNNNIRKFFYLYRYTTIFCQQKSVYSLIPLTTKQ